MKSIIASVVLIYRSLLLVSCVVLIASTGMVSAHHRSKSNGIGRAATQQQIDSLLNISVLLYIPQEIALREVPYIVEEEGKGYCAGSRLMLSVGPVYTAALRIALGDVVKKIAYSNIMPAQNIRDQAKYDAIIEPLIEPETIKTGVTFHSAASSRNGIGFGISTGGSGGLAGGQVYRFQPKIEAKIALRITLSNGESFTTKAVTAKSLGDDVGECVQLGEVFLATINHLRTPLVNELIPVLRNNFSVIKASAK